MAPVLGTMAGAASGETLSEALGKASSVSLDQGTVLFLVAFVALALLGTVVALVWPRKRETANQNLHWLKHTANSANGMPADETGADALGNPLGTDLLKIGEI